MSELSSDERMELRSAWDHRGNPLPVYDAAERIIDARLAPIEALHALQPWRPWASECPDPENHEHDDDGRGIADVCWDCPPESTGYCGECRNDDGESIDWPCGTARALTAAPNALRETP